MKKKEKRKNNKGEKKALKHQGKKKERTNVLSNDL